MRLQISLEKSLIVFVLFVFALFLAGVSPSIADEQKSPAKVSVSPASGGSSIFHETMADMTWQEVEKAAREGAVVLMTTAVIEQHGPHMGCGIDTYLGYLMCKLTRRELESRGIKSVIAPPLYWGINRTTHVFPGTFGVRKETMKALIHDIIASLKSWGFTDVFNINAHGDGGHIQAGLESIKEAGESLKVNARYLVSEDEAKRYGLTGAEPFICVHKSPPFDLESMEFLDIHAGAYETGFVAAFFPGQVDEELAKSLEPTRVTMSNIMNWVRDARKETPLGYVGDPAGFDARTAEKAMYEMCRMMADGIADSLGKGK